MFVVDKDGQPQAPKGGKTYTKEEARRVMFKLRKEGLNAYYTNGKKANRPLYKAFTATKGYLESVAKKYFGDI